MYPNKRLEPRAKRPPTAAQMILWLVAATLLAATSFVAVSANPEVGALPAGTLIRFHLLEPISSNTSKSGQVFNFALLDPIRIGDQIVVAKGAVGSGTIILAGHAGTSGHEGDLTLRIDSVGTPENRYVNFADQRLRLNGRNRKVQAGVLGFVPFVGIGAMLVRGSEMRLDVQTPIETVLTNAAPITAKLPASPAPSPSNTSAPQPSPTLL